MLPSAGVFFYISGPRPITTSRSKGGNLKQGKFCIWIIRRVVKVCERILSISPVSPGKEGTGDSGRQIQTGPKRFLSNHQLQYHAAIIIRGRYMYSIRILLSRIELTDETEGRETLTDPGPWYPGRPRPALCLAQPPRHVCRDA